MNIGKSLIVMSDKIAKNTNAESSQQLLVMKKKYFVSPYFFPTRISFFPGFDQTLLILSFCGGEGTFSGISEAKLQNLNICCLQKKNEFKIFVYMYDQGTNLPVLCSVMLHNLRQVIHKYQLV